MATNGLGSGFKQGVLQGAKTGLGYAPLKSGFVGGVSDGNMARDKIQDPALLLGEDLPWIYVNADYSINLSNSTVVIDPLNLPDKWLAYKNIAVANHPDYAASALFLNGNTFTRTGKAWDAGAAWVSMGTGLSSNDRAYPKVGGQNLGDHVYLDFGGVDGVQTGNNWFAPISSNGTAAACGLNLVAGDSFTVIMVMKSKNVTGKYHFYLDGPTLPGGYELKQQSATSLQSTLYGYVAGNVKASNYNTVSDLTDLQDWCVVTIKCTLKQKNGQGSEQEVYINGKFQHTLSTTTWLTPETTTTFPGNQVLILGTSSTSTPSANGMYLASFLMFPFWMNETEQQRLENYFRWYYAKKF